MDTAEFLQHVLPVAGPYCIAIKKYKSEGGFTYWHYPAQDIAEAVAIAQRLDGAGEDVFFAVGALKVAREWDREKERWKTPRGAENIRALRSYILDIDVGFKSDGTPRGYADIESAVTELKKFCEYTGLPRPCIVNSGGGLHVYWPLEEEVPTPEWREYGARLKKRAQDFGLRIDPGRTADPASVLRVVGAHNRKYDPSPQVALLGGEHGRKGRANPAAAIHTIISLNTVEAASPAQLSVALAGQPADLGVGDNTGKQERDLPDVDPRKLQQECPMFAYVCDPATAAQASEPAWHGAIAMALACGTKGERLAHEISKLDEGRYNAEYLNDRISRLKAKGYVAIKCTVWHDRLQVGSPERDICEKCKWWGKINSPAQVSHAEPKPLPPLQVKVITPVGLVETREIPEPPEPFQRFPEGIGVMFGNQKSGVPEQLVFCPCDMYPLRMQYDERTKLEGGIVWMVNLPHEGWTSIDVPHVTKTQLQKTLTERGIRIPAQHVDLMEKFMTAYVQKLQKDTPREMAYSKMGWRPEGFVVGDVLYRNDGVAEQHAMSRELDEATHSGMHVSGDFDAWRLAMAYYGRAGMEPFRIFLYSSFASALYSMSGQVATVVNASGDTGLGKSTLLEACASVWGDPRALVMRGTKQGYTINAIEAATNSMHHLPLLLDEITNREAHEVADLIFNYSGGKGKIRSKAGGGLRGDTASWSNLALTNANADEYARMTSVYTDSAAFMMRLVQLDFTRTGTITKEEGDRVRTGVWENYGHPGRLFAEHIAKNRAAVQKMVRDYVKDVDRQVGGRSEERYWVAWAAAVRTAAEIVSMLGILPGFPISTDMQWLYGQIGYLRRRSGEQSLQPEEIVSEYLDAQLPATLTISPKLASNISDVATEPRTGITVRFEADIGLAYVSRSHLQSYCIEHNINLSRILNELLRRKIVTNDNVRRVLGAGTKWAKGYVRCIEVDVTKLGGKAQLQSVQKVVAIGGAVV